MVLGNVSGCWTTTAAIGKPQKGCCSSVEEDDHKTESPTQSEVPCRNPEEEIKGK